MIGRVGFLGNGRTGLVSRIAASVGLAVGCLVVAGGYPAVAGGAVGGSVGRASVVSDGCAGPNAEVVQAVDKPHYVYESWIGCGGEGFARSVDGGLHFRKPITLPRSSSSDDPALAVAADGTVYVTYLRYYHNYAYPVVATSFDHGATFPRVASLIPRAKGNWGDRGFIAAGPGGTVYVTWDYGPSAADVKIVCSPIGSCAYQNVDATAVVQRSTDHGKTWSRIIPMQPGFPAGGGYDASVVVEPNGRVDALVWNHRLNPSTFRVHPGHEYFTSSSDAGRTWSRFVPVGYRAGSIALLTWWIDGDLAIDHAGNLYATWSTQSRDHNIGWISYSTNHGKNWSAPRQVLRGRPHAVANVEVTATVTGVADVAWQADLSNRGYSTYLRQFSIARGWLGPETRVSRHYGNPRIWPGDTFGVSVVPGHGSRWVILSWGSATDGHTASSIYAAMVHLRAR